MSDRRPENAEPDWQAIQDLAKRAWNAAGLDASTSEALMNAVSASVRKALDDLDPVAAVRRGVESGTIKGEVVTGELGDNALEFYQPDSGYGHIYIVIGPVSDGGSET